MNGPQDVSVLDGKMIKSGQRVSMRRVWRVFYRYILVGKDLIIRGSVLLESETNATHQRRSTVLEETSSGKQVFFLLVDCSHVLAPQLGELIIFDCGEYKPNILSLWHSNGA